MLPKETSGRIFVRGNARLRSSFPSNKECYHVPVQSFRILRRVPFYFVHNLVLFSSKQPRATYIDYEGATLCQVRGYAAGMNGYVYRHEAPYGLRFVGVPSTAKGATNQPGKLRLYLRETCRGYGWRGWIYWMRDQDSTFHMYTV